MEILGSDHDSVVIRVNSKLSAGDSDYENLYTIRKDGSIEVKAGLKIRKEEMPELPRFGMKLVMPGAYRNIDWYGRGPEENYWDRKSGSFIGVYSGTVMEQYTPYSYPQENGNKTDVRWISLTNDQGEGLIIEGLQPLEINAHHYLEDSFDEKITHTILVPFDNLTELCIDLHQMGVGGDNSWGEYPHAEYRLTEKEYYYGFIIRPTALNY